MNTEQFRQSLKLKWLNYYRDNREWLEQLGVWVSYEGQRRPSSSFVLATVSVLEPRLCQLMPIVVDLSSNPDRVVKALGLNFSPDKELEKAIANGLLSESSQSKDVKLLPPGQIMMNSAMSPIVDVEHSTRETSTTTARSSVDAVDLYLDQNLDQKPDPQNTGSMRSPHQVATERDADCHGVGGREPWNAPERGRPQNPPSSEGTSVRPLSIDASSHHHQPEGIAKEDSTPSEQTPSAVAWANESATDEPPPESNRSELDSKSPSNSQSSSFKQPDESEAIAASFGQRFSSNTNAQPLDKSSESSNEFSNTQITSSSEPQASEAYSV